METNNNVYHPNNKNNNKRGTAITAATAVMMMLSLVSILFISSTTAFQQQQQQQRARGPMDLPSLRQVQRRIRSTTQHATATSIRKSTTTLLFLSDVPKDDDGETNNKNNVERTTKTKTTTTTTSIPSSSAHQDDDHDNNDGGGGGRGKKLDHALWTLLGSSKFQKPKAPQDVFVLTGDLLSIFVYGVTNHFLRDCGDMMVKHAAATYSQQQLATEIAGAAAADAAATAAPSGGELSGAAAYYASSSSVSTVPVWLDAADAATQHAVQVAALQDRVVTQYSPALQYAGVATCLLAACWLSAAAVTGAYEYENTLECKTERALSVTLVTWTAAVSLMLLVLAISSSLLAAAAAGDASSASMLLSSSSTSLSSSFSWVTRGDLDYIMGSLSVLALWRFLASSMLGTGGGGGED